MKTTREFSSADRYVYDFGACTTGKGFAQLDTGQDASYFGMWANPFKRIIFSYIEGDCILEEAETEAEFVDAINKIKTFYDDSGYGFKGIDPGFNEELGAKFKEIGLGSLLH